MIRKILLALVIAVVVTLLCILVGGILMDIKVAIATTVGAFIKTYGTAIGILSGLYWYLTH